MPSRTRSPLDPDAKGGEPVTVFVVDDHDLVRKGLRYFLGTHDGIAIVGEAGDARSAVQGVAEHVPDVVLMDLLLPLEPDA